MPTEPTDPFSALGEYLTASEAVGLAALFEAGQHTPHALRSVNPGRRNKVKSLLSAARLCHTEAALTVSGLRAIAGAKSIHRDLTPVWTMPGNEASIGHLTSEFHRTVSRARVSITCATYNFTKNSNMWDALRLASGQPEVTVCVYVDGAKGDSDRVQAQLPRATVYRSANLPDGRPIVSHAKFIKDVSIIGCVVPVDVCCAARSLMNDTEENRFG